MIRNNCMWVEVCGYYSGKGNVTKVLANINGEYAEITRRQEREALRRIRAIGGDFLVCYSRPDGWNGRLPKVWVCER